MDERLESIKILKKEIDEVIDSHKRVAMIHGLDNELKLKINIRLAISKRLGKILGADR